MNNTVIAKNKEHLQQIIEQTIAKDGNDCDLNFIDTSQIEDMSYLFFKIPHFNGDISKWNTSNVTNMQSMFSNSIFNSDISNWNTCNVTNMSSMFSRSKFNGDISRWNTSCVNNMSTMFFRSIFNNDISQWNTQNVIDLSCMFMLAKFNGDIAKWNIFNVIVLDSIFESCYCENIPYWAKIEDFEERQLAYLERQKILQDKQKLDKVIVSKKDKQENFKI